MKCCYSALIRVIHQGLALKSSSGFFPILACSLGMALVALWLGSLHAAAHPSQSQKYAAGEVYCVKAAGGSYPACDHIYNTVQAALNAAIGGEEIRVSTGSYNGTAGIVANITKNVALLGGWNGDFTLRDPALYPTILDGRRLGRVVQITGNITPTLDGFTITRGNATFETFNPGKGGGIIITMAGPLIQNNVITNNIAYTKTSSIGDGGGIFTLNTAPTAVISANQIISNAANTGYSGLGGGLCVFNGSITVVRNEISNNIAGRGGGGVYLNGEGSANFDANSIISNLSTISPTATSHGGGIYFQYSAPFTLSNNLIARNGANTSGSGLHIYGVNSDRSMGVLINNTIVHNNFGANDDGIALSGYVTVSLINNIIAFQGHGLYAEHLSTANASYTLFYQNSTGNMAGTGTITNLYAITSLDPLFVSAGSSNYHLQPASPAIDSADPAGIPPALPLDIDGDTRPYGLAVDIGADEALFALFLPVMRK